MFANNCIKTSLRIKDIQNRLKTSYQYKHQSLRNQCSDNSTHHSRQHIPHIVTTSWSTTTTTTPEQDFPSTMTYNHLQRLVPFLRSGAAGGRALTSARAAAIGRQHNPRCLYWSRRPDVWREVAEDVEKSMARAAREFGRGFPFAGPVRSRFWDPFDSGFRTVPVETAADGQRVYKIALDLGPEFSPEDVNVSVKDREVTVKARKESVTDGCKQLREYSYQYSLPEEVNVDQIRSLFTTDGQLTIEAPLPPLKEPEATEIPVQRADK